MVTSPPLTNPGEPIQVVDDVMRYVSAYLPATITTPDWALVFSVPGEPVELYDMRVDPGQATNVAGDNPEVVGALRDRYLELLEGVGTAESYLAPRRSPAD